MNHRKNTFLPAILAVLGALLAASPPSSTWSVLYGALLVIVGLTTSAYREWQRRKDLE